jgi:hypothetical protein
MSEIGDWGMKIMGRRVSPETQSLDDKEAMVG